MPTLHRCKFLHVLQYVCKATALSLHCAQKYHAYNYEAECNDIETNLHSDECLITVIKIFMNNKFIRKSSAHKLAECFALHNF